VLQTQDLNQEASPTVTTTVIQDGNRANNEQEIIRLDIFADVGFYVMEFANRDLFGGDSIDDEAVPGAQQTVVLPYKFDGTAEEQENLIKEALADLRLVGGLDFVDDVELLGSPHGDAKRSFLIKLSSQLSDLPELQVFDTRLLLDGNAGDDVVSIQSIDQPTYMLGGDDNDLLNVNVEIGIGGPIFISPPEPLTQLIAQIASSNGVNDLLTVDGGEDRDQYVVYLFGGDINSQINLFDSGASTNDSGIVLGTENPDLFLLRAAVADDGLAFVAMLKPPVVGEVVDVERVNYRGSLDTLDLFGLGGDDAFGIDDTRINMNVYGGAGEDFFQIGQLYKSQRTAAAGVPNADVFTTIETTRGFLSNGISSPMTIFGGENNDEFVVYHNLAPLVLNGDEGDDSFLIRAFALVGSQEDLRERTDVSGGAGADLIRYAVNAPVNIDGGDGFDTVIVIGTEFNDDFVVTEDGIFGAGLNIQFTRVEKVEVDGAEGDDRFFILGTSAGILTKITGGLGSDTFFGNGPTPDVVSNDLLGHSGLISHSVDTDLVDPANSFFAGIKVEGISANIVDNDEPAIRVIISDGTSLVSQIDGLFDTYGIVLARKPEDDAEVIVTSFAPRGVRFTSDEDGVVGDGGKSVALTFDDTNWDTVQTVSFVADESGDAAITLIQPGGDGSNAIQVLGLGATEGSFTIISDSNTDGIVNFTTDPISFDIRDRSNEDEEDALDDLGTDIESALNAKIMGAGGIIADVTRIGKNFVITFLNTETLGKDVDKLKTDTTNLTANDFVGTSAAFITHEVSVIGEGDTISGKFVSSDVDGQRRGSSNVLVDTEGGGGANEVQILSFDATDGFFFVSLEDPNNPGQILTSEEMLFIPLDAARVGDSISTALNAMEGIEANVTHVGVNNLDYEYEIEFVGVSANTIIGLLSVDDSNLTKGERTIQIVGGLPPFVLAQGDDQLRGATIKIVDGAGIGQTRLIIANTADTITVANPWIQPLDETSRIEILRYAGVALPATLVEIVGNDGKEIDLRETGGETVAFEAFEVHGFVDGDMDGLDDDGTLGLVDTITVSLTSAPTSDVTVAFDSDDAFMNTQLFFAIETSPGVFEDITATGLIFDDISGQPNSWNEQQTVYVFGTDDTLTEGFHKGALTLTATGGDYDATSSIVVDIGDNEVAGVMVLEKDGSTDVIEVDPPINTQLITNGDFEVGNFNGWESKGTTSIVTGEFGSGPTEGTYQALLSTGGTTESDTELESFLGLTGGSLDGLGNGNATSGSAIRRTITVNAGEVLSFDWDFFTNEATPSSFNDFAFVSIAGTASELADTSNVFVISPTVFGEETGFQTFTHIFTVSGSFTIGVGVTDEGDTIFDSGLLVDNFKLFTNDSFETGDFSGWDTTGEASIQTAAFGSGPTEGTYQALLSTGGATVNDASLESFLGLDSGDLDGLNAGDATEGTAIRRTVTVFAGEELSFDWNFFTNETTPTPPVINDFAFVSIAGTASELADTNSVFMLSPTVFGEETGFQTFSHTFTTAGTFTIGVGVTDVGDTIVDSGLLVDNFRVDTIDPFDAEPWVDSYQLVLTKALEVGETVRVNLSADLTRTQRGAGLLGIRAFEQEVILSDSTLSFSHDELAANAWFLPQAVSVKALNDSRVDGGDSKSFPTMLDQANSIEGPLEITGGLSEDRSADLEREPVILPGETNFKPSLGTVQDTPMGEDPSFTLTIDLDEIIDGETIVNTLVEGGTDGITKMAVNTNGDPGISSEVQILTIDAVSGTFKLTLNGHPETDAINYDPSNPFAVANEIESKLNAKLGVGAVTVEDSGTSFIITFDGVGFFQVDQPLLEVSTNDLTRVGTEVESNAHDPTQQILKVYGNGGTFKLKLGLDETGSIAFSPDNPSVIQAQVIENALNTALDMGGSGLTANVLGSGSTYFIIFDANPGVELTVIDEDLRVDEVQTLTVNASSGDFHVSLDGGVTFAPDLLIDPALSSTVTETELAEAIESLGFTDVTVVKDVDNPFYTIIYNGPGGEDVPQIEVGDLTLQRTVKEALETNLNITINEPDDLKDFALEITRGDAKNKVRLILGGSDPDASPDSGLTVLNLSRPWEGGLTDAVPSSSGPGLSEFTIEKVNRNLLVDENEETDFFFLNDTENVTSIDELPTAELIITADRLRGLGMGGDQMIGDRLIEGGIRYTGLEELFINLGSGDNRIVIADTHRGATTINAGDGDDTFFVESLTGHTFLNASAGADVINVATGLESLDPLSKANLEDILGVMDIQSKQKLEDINALLTVTGDVAQAVALTLGKGSEPDLIANVAGVDEVQQITVDATDGTFKVGFVKDGMRYFTPALDHAVSAEILEAELQLVLNTAFGVDGTVDDLDDGDTKTEDVLVTRGGNVYRITFSDEMGNQDVPLLDIDDFADPNDPAHFGLTMESGAVGDVLNISNSADTADTVALMTDTSLTGLGMGDLGIPDTTFNEIQTLRLNATGGTFRLRFMDDETSDLAFDITAADLQAELETVIATALSLTPEEPIDNIRVMQNDDVYVFYFRGLLTNTEVAPIEVVEEANNLTRLVELPGGAFTTDGGDLFTDTRLEGITAAVQNEIQELLITATGGTFTLAFPDDSVPENITAELPFDVTRANLQLALEGLPGIAPGDVIVSVVTGGFQIEFANELSSQNVPEMIVNDTNLTGGTATVAQIQAGLDTGLNNIQVMTVNASEGFFQLQLYVPIVQKTLLTESLAHDASAEQVRRALQHELARELNNIADDADLSRTREAFKSDFSVARIDNVYIIGFQGVTRQLDGGEGVSFLKVIGDTDFNNSGSAEVRTRMDGINFYGIEQINLDMGSGTDVLNIQGTSPGSFKLDRDTVHAATNITLSDGDERIYISSNADLDHNTIDDADVFEFLTGHLDGISGNLNLDVGEGRHRLLISDEAATAGDDNIRISDNIMTATGGDDFDDTNAAEIQIQGLAFGDITYGAHLADGDFYDGIIYWTGSGDDTITIDGTHVRDESVERTTTQLNTGLGDDHVTVDLDEPEDGFFVLHTMGAKVAHTPVDPGIAASDDDTVRAAASTLPLIIFGGLGDDDIIAGQNEDVVFGDFGRVQYLDEGGELIAVFGFGARDDMISSVVIDPTWVISRDLNLGGVDILEGQDGDDILIGGTGGNSIGDYIDGDSDDDLIFGDAVRLERRDIDVTMTLDENITNPRYQELHGQMLYARNDVPDFLQNTGAPVLTDGLPNIPADNVGYVLVDGIPQPIRHQDGDLPATWNEYEIVELYHSFDVEAGNVAGQETSFGDDYIAGGSDHDIIFGQLGDDVIQGDGSIETAVGLETVTDHRLNNPQPGLDPVYATRVANGTMELAPDTALDYDNSVTVTRWELDIVASFDATTDGDDYIEGNGGSDTIFGNLGQDDIVGGSSSLFTLNDRLLRPDVADTIFGGSGTAIQHNALAEDVTDVVFEEKHARDSDAIAGDNANIYRIVGAQSVTDLNGDPVAAPAAENGFLTFGYDASRIDELGDPLTDARVIVRAIELLDYTPGGPDYDAAGAADDIGGGDEIHGETGDDFVYGQKGADVLLGNSESDDLVGGWGPDWISGGQGLDGVLGDDGRIYTGRYAEFTGGGNKSEADPGDGDDYAEALNGVLEIDELNKEIRTPGNIQQYIIHPSIFVGGDDTGLGEIFKQADLTPFNLTPAGQQDDWEEDDIAVDPHYANDIIFGGLGNDFLHGGAGDDAMSGAEALPWFYDAPINPDNPTVTDTALGTDVRPQGGDDFLRFNPTRIEFEHYDEHYPRELIGAPVDLDGDGVFVDGFLLNFDPAGDPDTGEAVNDNFDEDMIFGDTGNDWIVGGPDNDQAFGGWGADLMNMDDELVTNGNVDNDEPDPINVDIQDRAYGGAGRDVLIANPVDGLDRRIQRVHRAVRTVW
jgi:Ca2+-binding RTX toxin-like protein